MQKHLEISTQQVPGQQNRSFLGAIPDQIDRHTPAKPKRLGLLAGLIVAVGVALLILIVGRPPESATNADQASQATRTMSEPGSEIETSHRAGGDTGGSPGVSTMTTAEQWAAEGLYDPAAPDYFPALPDNPMSSTAAIAERLQAEGSFFPEDAGYFPGIPDPTMSSTTTGTGSGLDNGVLPEDPGYFAGVTDGSMSSAGILVDPALVDGSLDPNSADKTSSSAMTDEAIRLADGFGYYGEQP